MSSKPKRGRPQIPVGDLVIALCLATYFNRPSRKAISGPGVEKLTVFSSERAPKPITLRLAMKSARLTRALVLAIETVSNAVRKLETHFAVDSSYFKTPNSMIHVQRRGKGVMVLEKIRNAKLHIAVGLKTLMIVAADVSDDDAHDSPFFVKLLDQFNRRFQIDRVLADAAYDFPANYEAVHACGGEAYFDQKSNTKLSGLPHHDEMVRMKKDDYDTYEDRYRFRSLVECANSSIKRTIKRAIRARLEESRYNELLLVCLVYNLLRLMEARIQFGIDISWADDEALDKLDAIRVGTPGDKAA